MIRCPLCGNEFDEKQAEAACKGCPFAGGCDLVKCPNCQYEMPRRSRLLSLFKKLRSRGNGSG